MKLITYIGGLLMIEAFKGTDIKDAEITVLNADGTPFDFTGGTGYLLSVYESDTRKRLLFKTTNLTVNANVITWSDKWADIDVKQGSWYQGLTFIDVDGDIQIIEFGNFNVI